MDGSNSRTSPPAGDLTALVVERAHRLGPLPFDDVVDHTLYHPQLGFYAGGAGAGRRRDYLTSPELGPLFGAVVARALDAWWEELDRPDPFVVVEAGAGTGTLASTVLDAAPACAPALRYVLVERSEELRRRQTDRLPIEPAMLALGPAVAVADGDHDEGRHAVPGVGPVVTALEDLPAGPVIGVVLANELLDNLPFGLLERRRGGWVEVRVGESAAGSGRLAEVLVPAPPHVADEADRLAPAAPDGGRVPRQARAAAWLRQALGLVERGRVVVVDYADTTGSMARRPWRTWVRTYRAHGPGRDPLDDLGGQDVTCEVAVDQLAHVRAPALDRPQAEFLAAHGLEPLVASARATWQARARLGDLPALAARSRVTEARALTDPAGLGAFRVLEWMVGRPR